MRMVARAGGDAACERERLTSVANTVIEGVPGISHAKVVRCRERVKLTAWIPAFLTMDSSFYTPHFLGKLHTRQTLLSNRESNICLSHDYRIASVIISLPINFRLKRLQLKLPFIMDYMSRNAIYFFREYIKIFFLRFTCKRERRTIIYN